MASYARGWYLLSLLVLHMAGGDCTAGGYRTSNFLTIPYAPLRRLRLATAEGEEPKLNSPMGDAPAAHRRFVAESAMMSCTW